MDTSLERLSEGEVIQTGRSREFLALRAIEGQPHLDREDLHSKFASPRPSEPRARLVHITDFQLCDPSSPTRFEFVNKLFGIASAKDLFPGHRAQETLIPFAIAQAIAYINELSSKSSIDMCLITGDTIDNSQANEAETLLSLLSGEALELKKTFGQYFGVQSTEWNDDFFWHPDSIDDQPKSELGYPTLEGLFKAINDKYPNQGLLVPWLLSNGNHEVLIQGMGACTEASNALAVGGQKAFDFGDNIDYLVASRKFETDPSTVFSKAERRPVEPSSQRRLIQSHEFIEMIRETPGLPNGHGFLDKGGLEANFNFVHLDRIKGIVYIFLDTAVRSGGARGGIDNEQFEWLKSALAQSFDEIQSPSPIGIIVSHHGLDEIDFNGNPEVTRSSLVDLIHSYRQIRLWFCGHTHENRILAIPNPNRADTGLFQITSASMMDWPCSIREASIYDYENGEIEVELTMHHSNSAKPKTITSIYDLASWHQLIAANSPYIGIDSFLEGAPEDQNVRLWFGAID